MTVILLGIWLVLTTNSSQIVKGWRDIRPLRSTRADVELVLGAPTRSCTEICHYEAKTESIFIHYSRERCANSETNPLNIPPDTVVSVTVYSENKPRLKHLKLNMKKFKRTEDPELHGYATYTNEEIGMTYEVSDKQLVLSVESFGSAKDIQSLRCR